MSEYSISRIYPSDKAGLERVDRLLEQEGIRRDANLDYTCGIYDEDLELIATGSCFGNTLRCLAVDSQHQGEGLMNQIVSHLSEVQYERGNYHQFLYTKISTAKFFGDLGFYEIARVDDRLVFMENKRTGFSDYLSSLERSRRSGSSAAIVMNANPFTLGHLYLVETAAAAYDWVHVFVVSEDSSLFPFSVRKELVEKGTSQLENVICHESGPYIISNATFPSYFLRDKKDVIESHARLDARIFIRIAEALGISARYVGEEPTSLVTGIYNRVLSEELPKKGIDCIIVPRRTCMADGDHMAVSASSVREAIKSGDSELLKLMLPRTTLDYLESPEAEAVKEKIKASDQVRHY